jgi:hypothetical protein
MPKKLPIYYSLDEICEIFHKSKDVMRRKITAGKFGDTLNDGKTHLVSEEGLKQYIDAHTGPAHYNRHFSSKTKGHSDYRKPIIRIIMDDVKRHSA